MRIGHGQGRQMTGAALALCGVLLVFLCLPMQFFLIVLGILLAAAGFMLIGYDGRIG